MQRQDSVPVFACRLMQFGCVLNTYQVGFRARRILWDTTQPNYMRLHLRRNYSCGHVKDEGSVYMERNRGYGFSTSAKITLRRGARRADL